MAGRESDLCLAGANSGIAMAARGCVREHRHGDIALGERGTKIRAGAFDSAGMRREKLADMENAQVQGMFSG